MDQFVPDMYQKSVYTINYDKLIERGIKCLLFDLDNTLVPIHGRPNNKKIKELFEKLTKQGFKVFIFSNSLNKRVKMYSELFNVEFYSFTCKPSSKSFMKVMKEQDFTISEIAIIGDQLLTDIKGGNKLGITTILINPISKKDSFFTKFNRFFEKRIMKRLGKNNLLMKGKYYE